MKEKEEKIIRRVNKSLEKVKKEINKMDYEGKGLNIQLKIGLVNPSTVLVRPPITEIEAIRETIK